MGTQQEIDDVMQAINDSCQSKGGVYKDYGCQVVSWDDVQRGEVGGQLSCWGGNITDTRLWEKEGARLFTVRSENWNEKLGKISADKVALLTGSHIAESQQSDLRVTSLKQFLENVGIYGSYAGLPGDQTLYDKKLDTEVSIRFQTTFLPVKDEEKATLEFASEAYNYNTTSDNDPKNLLLLCTTQGTAVQQDGAGAKKLYHHRVDSDNVIHRHWLEAERTKHKVGGPQKETEEEKSDAIARGKAVSNTIGLESMESRFNVLMTVQIPLAQKKPEPSRNDFMMMKCFDMPDGGPEIAYCCAAPAQPRCMRKKRSAGKSNAARVSRGTEVDTWTGLSIDEPKRHPKEHITVTVVIYNTVAGGVPSEADVIAAINDMENLYDSCAWTGRLADDGAGFMKSELTVKQMIDIKKKITEQPPGGKPGPCPLPCDDAAASKK